ncbi:hypothetical protein EVAR_17309_1 [Eumeta japonica]|uniref:Kazal-like domain-containing protein n=1 Tax=Eumeta variegata TaxID=151549 RepID=A0A4C1TT49_EUMVA|nr:hypothetical protein EVAR_17309_1 [Eumeta japonica]
MAESRLADDIPRSLASEKAAEYKYRFIYCLFVVVLAMMVSTARAKICVCPRIYMPLCAGRRTFDNRCLLDCENVQRARSQKQILEVTCDDSCESCY